MIKLKIQDFKNLEQIIILFYHNNVFIWQTYSNIQRKGKLKVHLRSETR